MAKKKTEQSEIFHYRVETGFNDSKERRFEIGDEIADGVLAKKDIAALLEMKAIEIVEEIEETK